MIRQRFHIEKYNWKVTAYYAISGYYYNEIMSSLKRIGCSGNNLQLAEKNLRENNLNSGLTYSNYAMRETVMVVALASSAKQFHMALMHEIRHL